MEVAYGRWKIIGLYWERNEDAITETSSKYGKLFFRIASNILLNHEDSEECVNDTYLGLWNAIPKERPSPFSVFASRITRILPWKSMNTSPQKSESQRRFVHLKNLVTVFLARSMLKVKQKIGASSSLSTHSLSDRGRKAQHFFMPILVFAMVFIAFILFLILF